MMLLLFLLKVFRQGPDSIPFVYLKNGTRQVVVLGESNENNVVVDQGLQPGIQVYLSTPAKAEDFKLVGEELMSVIREREKAKKAEELRLREEAEKAKQEAVKERWNDGQAWNEYYSGNDAAISEHERQSAGQSNGRQSDTASTQTVVKTRSIQQQGVRDTSRRRTDSQSGQQGTGQNSKVSAEPVK